METFRLVKKGFFRKGQAQGLFRSEYNDMLNGALLAFEFNENTWYFSSAGLDYVYKHFSQDPELDKLNIPASYFISAKLQTNPKRLTSYIEEVARKTIGEADSTQLELSKESIMDEVPQLEDQATINAKLLTATVEEDPDRYLSEEDRFALGKEKELPIIEFTKGIIDNQKFNEIVESRIDKIRASLIKKGEEYANKDLTQDRLYNFKRGAQILGTTPESVLFGYALKHVTSIIDIVKQIEKGILPSEELIDEKIMDIINYMILLDAMIKDTRLNEATH